VVGGFLNRDFGVLTLLRASLKNAILKIVRNTAVPGYIHRSPRPPYYPRPVRGRRATSGPPARAPRVNLSCTTAYFLHARCPAVTPHRSCRCNVGWNPYFHWLLATNPHELLYSLQVVGSSTLAKVLSYRSRHYHPRLTFYLRLQFCETCLVPSTNFLKQKKEEP
jgi:hypothetical protein